MTLDDHREFGLQSNIPECCVEEWLAVEVGLRKLGGGHVWGVGQRRCVAHPDCGWRPQAIQMLDRGLPDVPCAYVPCRRCHAEIVAGVRQPNALRIGEYQPLTPTSGNQENDVQPTSGGSNE